MLYERYLQLVNRGKIVTGFSKRLPDYGTQFWFDQLEDLVNRSKKKRFLDIGAGGGRLSILLSSFFEKGTAVEVDVSKQSWQSLLNEYKNIELREGLLQQIVPKLSVSDRFDVVVMAEVFEHIPPKDLPEFLMMLYKIVAEDGRIFLTTPNAVTQGPAEKSSMWYQKQPWGHYKHYTYNELKNILWDHGFEIESCVFECNTIKQKVYNRFYYPAARLDNKLIESKKVPSVVRSVYKGCSWPFVLFARSTFWFLAKFLRSYEQEKNNENNALTTIIVVGKRSML